MKGVDRLLQNDLSNESNMVLAATTSKVLQIIAHDQDDDWFHAHAEILARLVQKGMSSDDEMLYAPLLDTFERLSSLYPLPKEEEQHQGDLASFHTFIYTQVGENLRNSTSLRGTLLMLRATVLVNPERIESFCAPMIKVFNKLAKDHIANPAVPPTFEIIAKLITWILEICQISITFLGDSRRIVLSVLIVLVEKSRSPALCRYMLGLARNWAMNKQNPLPTMKEKAGFLHKMASYETRGEPLLTAYLELIYDIYMDTSLRRSDLTSRLEHSFLLGCRTQNPAIREKFLALLDTSVPNSLISRMVYILAVQSWDALAEHNWIYLANHLLMGAIDVDLPPSADKHNPVCEIPRPTTQTFVRPIQQLLYGEPQASNDCWVSLFASAWSCLSRKEQGEVNQHMINLLAKDYHTRQAELRPNVIQTLLHGVHALNPAMTLPASLVKYLAKTFNAWHVGIEILNGSLDYLVRVVFFEPFLTDVTQVYATR